MCCKIIKSAVTPHKTYQIHELTDRHDRPVRIHSTPDRTKAAIRYAEPRRGVQQLAMQCFVPMITAGTNITVADGFIQDMSGEVITVRAGDRRCLNCLGRINLARLAAESHNDAAIRAMAVQRGYVGGLDVKEPAVKTLNTILATLAVERLLDQYQPNRKDIPILVYENTPVRAVYEDRLTLENRNPSGCSVCDV